MKRFVQTLTNSKVMPLNWAAEFTPEELALYILNLTVKDPDTLPKVEIAREKPLPFKPSGGGFNNRKGGRGNGRGRDNRRGGRSDRKRDDRDNNSYRDFKRTSSKKQNVISKTKDNKTPTSHNQSEKEKQDFVIRK